MKRTYNWIPDKKDHRDHLHAAPIPANLPTKVDLRALFSPIENQNELGSCTSHAAVGGAFEFIEIKELKDKATVAPEEFGTSFQRGSRLFHYYNERVLMGTVNEDSGAEIRDSVKALAQWGVCPEPMWPYIEDKFTVKPPATAYAEATKHKITMYQRIINLPQMKATLASGYPFVFGIFVYESFESDQVAASGIVPMPQAHEQCVGGHAVCAAGYDDEKKAIIVRNSWGTDWGDKGYFYLPYDFVQNPNLASDFWVIKR